MCKKSTAIWKILGTAITLVLIYYIAQNVKDVELIIRDSGVAGPVVAVALFCIFALTPIPAEPLTLFSIYFFGPLTGGFVIWLGGTTAALIEYYFGFHMRKIGNVENTIKKLPFGLNKMPIDSPYFLIFGRMIPGYGSKVISLVAGIHHVSLKKYLWTTAVMNIIGSVIIAYGGYHFFRFLKL